MTPEQRADAMWRVHPKELQDKGITRQEYYLSHINEAVAAAIGDRPMQQLVARIKRTSKYYGQTEPGAWFDVHVIDDRSYRLRGNNNNYQIGDVVLGVRLEVGEVVELKDR